MKIRKIKFSNINNLKGEHEINFDNAPLKTAGIFAITGPTGSGKSTILDVITLSLFNRVPRFKKAISKGEIQGLGSIITHHTKEAAASIEYEIKGQVYVSSWSVAKTRNNTLKDYEMSLMDASGSYLDLKRSEVPTKNEEIIGLKYDQFIKSIILSQGQFSRFLKADKNERGQLLENLTGTSIYRKIGIQAYQKFKDVSTQVQQEKARLEDIQPLDAEARKAIEAAIETSGQEVVKLGGQLAELDALIAVKSDLQNIKLELEKNQAEKVKHDERVQTAQAEETRLAQHEKLSGYQGDLRLYEKAKSDAAQFASHIGSLKEQQAAASSSIDLLLAEVSKLVGQTTEEAKVNAALNQFEQAVLELDRLKNEKRQQGIDQRAAINRLASQYHVNIPERIAPKEALDMLQKDQRQLMEQIAAAGLKEQSNISESKALLKQQNESQEILKNLLRLLTEQQQQQNALATEKEQLEETNEQLSGLAPLIAKCEQLIEQLQQNEALLRKQKEDALKIASLENLRLELENDKPCPLCGAVHHPYAEHAPADQRSALDEEIQKAAEALHAENKQLNQERQKHTALSTQKKHLEESISQKATVLEKLAEQVAGLSQRYQGKEALELEALTVRLPRLSTENKQLEKGIEALEQLKVNRELTQGFERFLQVSEEYVKADKARKEKFSDTDIQQHCEQLNTRFQNAQAQMLRLNTEIESAQKQSNEAQNEQESLRQKLEPLAKAEGYASIEELGGQLLTEVEVARIRTNREALQKAQAALEDNKTRLEARLKSQTQLDTQPETKLAELQTAKYQTGEKQRELNISLGANQARLEQDDKDIASMANKAEALQKLEKELEKWSLLQRMIGDAMGNKFSNFAQGLTLQNLLVYANRRLQKLSDRYLLIKPEDEGALKVIDQYQGNSERSVTTLSGGETFLLSLALALSLSDMASKNVSLDSLFIDEGFGTLDQETLDVAMTTLERLQSESQKTVGVISHVEALKERITVQVKLQKDALGYSQIKVE